MGRCGTGWRVCPKANSALEEDCISNPARISHVEIIAGPGTGDGKQYWDLSQEQRDVALSNYIAQLEAAQVEGFFETPDGKRYWDLGPLQRDAAISEYLRLMSTFKMRVRRFCFKVSSGACWGFCGIGGALYHAFCAICGPAYEYYVGAFDLVTPPPSSLSRS